MRSLIWHKDQKCVCALVLVFVNDSWTPRQHDRFVLIGLAGPMDVVNLSLSLGWMDVVKFLLLLGGLLMGLCWLKGRSGSLQLQQLSKLLPEF